MSAGLSVCVHVLTCMCEDMCVCVSMRVCVRLRIWALAMAKVNMGSRLLEYIAKYILYIG